MPSQRENTGTLRGSQGPPSSFCCGTDQILQALLDENTRQQSCFQEMEKELQGLPPGSLCFKKTGSNPRPYQQVYADGKRIQKSIGGQRELVELLARKHIIRRMLPVLRSNVKALSTCIAQYRPWAPDALIAALPPSYQGIRQRCFQLLGKPDIDAWLAAPFKQNPLYPEQRIHPTLRGEKVRSKSEMTLANLLYAAGIPYRYEALLCLDGQDYYPDFTILDPVTGKIYYWEHFGKTGERVYMARADNKIAFYREHGIVQWQNLLVTYDTPEGAVDAQMMQRMIELFFGARP